MWISNSSAGAGNSSSFSVSPKGRQSSWSRGQEIPRWSMYRHSWREYVTWDLCFIHNAFVPVKIKTYVLGTNLLKNYQNFWIIKLQTNSSDTLYSRIWSLTNFVRVQKFLDESNQHSLETKLNYTSMGAKWTWAQMLACTKKADLPGWYVHDNAATLVVFYADILIPFNSRNALFWVIKQPVVAIYS